jgi:dTDP-4-dehydrorhamnose reductase
MSDTGAALIIGADSVLGRAIASRERQLGNRVIETRRSVADGSQSLDIGVMATTWPIPPQTTIAYFCAAMTSQRECQMDFSRAYAVNVTGTCALVRRLVDAGLFVVFPSTNLVFDGSQPFVSPAATPCPQTSYGKMKAEAEAHLLAYSGRVGVVRLSKLVHEELPVFTHWRLAFESGLDVRPFHDMVFSPLPLATAVDVLVAVAHSHVAGVVQASAAEDISYAEACHALARRQGVPASRVRPISWMEHDEPLEHAPAHTTLDSNRASEVCGFRAPRALAALDQALGEP